MGVYKLTEEDISSLLPLVLARTPGTFELSLIGFIKCHLSGVVLYDVYADMWPSFTTILVKPCNTQPKVVPKIIWEQVLVYTQNPAGIESFLTESHLLDFHQPFQFQACAPTVALCLAKIVRKHGGKAELLGPSYAFDHQPTAEDIHLPEGYSIGQIKPDAISKMIDGNYQNIDNTAEEMSFYSQHLPSSCIYNKQNDPVSWSLIGGDGLAISMTYTILNERRKGLASNVYKYLAKACAEKGYSAHSFVECTNKASLAVKKREDHKQYPGELYYVMCNAAGPVDGPQVDEEMLEKTLSGKGH